MGSSHSYQNIHDVIIVTGVLLRLNILLTAIDGY